MSPELGEAHGLAMLLVGVANTMRLRFDDSAGAFDLSGQQARALLAIDEGGTPMRALADDLRCDASNVTGIADRLESRGLVAREAAPGDRRVKLLTLTSEGHALREGLMAQIVEDAPVMAALDADERATLRGLLGKILSAEGAAADCAGPHDA